MEYIHFVWRNHASSMYVWQFFSRGCFLGVLDGMFMLFDFNVGYVLRLCSVKGFIDLLSSNIDSSAREKQRKEKINISDFNCSLGKRFVVLMRSNLGAVQGTKKRLRVHSYQIVEKIILQSKYFQESQKHLRIVEKVGINELRFQCNFKVYWHTYFALKRSNLQAAEYSDVLAERYETFSRRAKLFPIECLLF